MMIEIDRENIAGYFFTLMRAANALYAGKDGVPKDSRHARRLNDVVSAFKCVTECTFDITVVWTDDGFYSGFWLYGNYYSVID